MKKMYKGKVNSPQTQLIEDIGINTTNIKILDASVFPGGPNLAVIGNDAQAETIKYESINSNVLVGCVRGFQGKAIAWKKDSVISRNFTEYDLDAIQENILELDNNKIDKTQITDDYSSADSNMIASAVAVKTLFDAVNEGFQERDNSHNGLVENLFGELQNKADKDEIRTKLSDLYDDADHRTVSDDEKNKWNNKVDKVVGKDLSSNDFTNAEKEKLEGIEIGANKITKVSQLTNDENFKTEAEIQTLINNSTKLKKEIVTSLPSDGKEDVIYLLKNKNDTNNFYTEYMWIGGKWEIIGDTKVDLSGYAKKSDIKTKLSELIDDENHQTVTNEEKQKLNNIKLSRAATFIIANYDSSENSKVGADYVIQESECAAEIINSFVNKLPVYGGKILLTEGNFNPKKNLGVNLNKNNIIIEGYGNSTTIIDKQSDKERVQPIIKIETNAGNCKILNLNITHNSGGSITIQGNKATIKNITIKNNGPYDAIRIEKEGNTNILDNITIENPGLYSNSFLIIGNNNTLTNCIGTSSSGKVFSISENNNTLINCTGTSSSEDAFSISENNNTLINCTGTSSSKNAFSIWRGNNNTLTNCTGTSSSKNAFYIGTNYVSLVGCFAETKDNTKYSIYLAYNTKYNIILGNHYKGKEISNSETNNIVVNNIKMEEI